MAGIGISEAEAEAISYDETPSSAILQDTPDAFRSFNALFVGTKDFPSASDNSVTVDYAPGMKDDPVFVFGGLVENGVSENNTVYIKNGRIVYDVYGSAGSGSSEVIGNRVLISGGSIGNDVFGGRVSSNVGGEIAITGNSVALENSSVDGNIYGGYGEKGGNNDLTVKVTENHVTVTSGTVGSHIDDGYGGYLNGGNIYGGYGYDYGNGQVNRNTVAISGSSLIMGNIYGGYSPGAAFMDGTFGPGSATTDNTVTLEGSDITIGHENDQGAMQYGSVWGGKSVDGAGISFNDSGATATEIFNKVISGNTLNLKGYRGTVSGIYNFENYNWTLPADVVNGDTLVTIAADGTPVNLTGTRHTVADMQAGDNRLKGGDTVTFITKTQGILQAQGYTVKQGQFIVYDATLAQQAKDDGTALVLTINGKNDSTPDNNGGGTDSGGNTDNGTNSGGSAAKLNPQSKSYAEGRAASLAFINWGNDLISSAGIDKIRVMVRADEEKARRPALIPFVIANGSSQRYKTGSHADIDGFNLAAGLAAGGEFGAGHKATAGIFFEYGRGNYDTYNSFSNVDPVRGDGDADYKGGGIFGRIDFAGTGLGRALNMTPDQADGFYAEASLRAGRARNTFSVGRHTDIYGNFGGAYCGAYDSTSTYIGGHLAGGYVFNFDDRQSLDVYGRYLWTHLGSDTVTVANEKLHFDSAASSRLQIGGRYAYAYGERFKPYIGAAYEYEFDGDIKARAYEFDLARPSLKGSTGIFEIGFSWQPVAANRDFSVQVNAQGYVGRRQGGGGGVKLKYQF